MKNTTSGVLVQRLAAGFVVLLMLAFATLATPGEAVAQNQKANIAVEGNVPGGTQGNTSDSDFWRQLRHGAQGTVVGVNQQRGLLIQSQGNDWWQTRSGTIGMYLAWGMLGIVVVLALFFAIRGRIKVRGGFSGETIQRFKLIERTGHWLLASSFIILALTGLNLLYGRDLLIPILGKDAFSALAVGGKYIHNYVAFAFMASLVMVAVMWVVHNIPNRHDLAWFLSGGGIIGKKHPSARKFNAGQKILFWLIILCGISISLSGWALLYPFTTAMFSETFGVLNGLGMDLPYPLAPIQEQQYASLWHTIMAGVMIAVVLGHIYIGTIGMEGAIDAMTSGDVDLNWAKEHHDLWVEEVHAGKGATGASQPAE